jgi:hypothetical protein
MTKQVTFGAAIALALFLGIVVFGGSSEAPAPQAAQPSAAMPDSARDLSPTIAILAEAPAPAVVQEAAKPEAVEAAAALAPAKPKTK